MHPCVQVAWFSRNIDERKSMRLKKLIVSGLVVVIGALAFASVSLGASHHPKGEFSNFGECPLNRASIEWCAYSKSSKGEFVIGKKAVPLVNPVTLQGGYEEVAEEKQAF